VGQRAIRIDEKDNVATAVCHISKGDEVLIEGITCKEKIKAAENIPFGHKIALIRIKKGELVIKYGEPIGKATSDIDVGQHVHVHRPEGTG